jgi:hypothetical protein
VLTCGNAGGGGAAVAVLSARSLLHPNPSEERIMPDEPTSSARRVDPPNQQAGSK